jgi:hypothetical protein
MAQQGTMTAKQVAALLLLIRQRLVTDLGQIRAHLNDPYADPRALASARVHTGPSHGITIRACDDENHWENRPGNDYAMLAGLSDLVHSVEAQIELLMHEEDSRAGRSS